jgi:ABC-type oligopeptide transport system ATPase subunit
MNKQGGLTQDLSTLKFDQPLIRIENLSVDFSSRLGSGKTRAVDQISLNLYRGETLGLVGESGSGKTTTGRAILRLQDLSGGLIELNGQDITTLKGSKLRSIRRHMQFIQQNPYASLNPRMTIGDSIAEPLKVHHLFEKDEEKKQIGALLEGVGLDSDMQSRFPHAFSGGQRQRIVIARALAVKPDFVVCDEPVSALDVRTQAQVIGLLTSLQKALHLTYLFIAHDLAVVRQIADRVAVMYSGQILEIGPADEIYDNPRHDYTKALLHAVPIPNPQKQKERMKLDGFNIDFSSPEILKRNKAISAEEVMYEVSPGHWVSRKFSLK